MRASIGTNGTNRVRILRAGLLACLFWGGMQLLPRAGAQQTGPGGVPGAGGVRSVFGRTGAVVGATGDYTAAQVTNAAATNVTNTFSAPQTIGAGNQLRLQDPAASFYYALSTPANANYMLFEDSQSTQYLTIVGDGSGLLGPANGLLVDGAGCLGFTPNLWNSTEPANITFCGSQSGTAGIVTLGNGTGGDSTGWLQLTAIGNGSSSNTDLRGHITLSSGTGTYSFTASRFTQAPTCVATDTTNADAVKVTATTSALTITGNGSDVVNYLCAD